MAKVKAIKHQKLNKAPVRAIETLVTNRMTKNTEHLYQQHKPQKTLLNIYKLCNKKRVNRSLHTCVTQVFFKIIET